MKASFFQLAFTFSSRHSFQRTSRSFMSSSRTIEQVVAPTASGPNQRLVGTVDVDGKGTLHSLEEVDPFILLDQGTIPKNGLPPFGAHPHRGHSVVTVVMRGRVKSWDSFDEKETTIKGPASYWVNAASGIFHDEVSVIENESDPKQHVSLFQLWIGIKEKDRKKKPSLCYDTDLKSVDAKNGETVVGSIRYFVGGTAKIETPHPIVVAHVSQLPNTTFRFPIDPKHGGFIVNLSGSDYLESDDTTPASFAGTTPENTNDVLVLSDNGGDCIQVQTAADSGADYLVCVGEKHSEAWAKKLVANGAVIAATPEEAREIAVNVELYAKAGKEGGSFSPFGV
jgi:redox-sensitive bicupin YhaK (pirin superfamily)